MGSELPYFLLRPRGAKGLRPHRASRRPPTGTLLAQQCRLVFDPRYGVYGAYDCLVTDIANGGYGICLINTRLGPDHLAGMDAFLEQPDKTLIPVELRWVRGPKIGLKRLPRGGG
jgi:hypothetical protein